MNREAVVMNEKRDFHFWRFAIHIERALFIGGWAVIFCEVLSSFYGALCLCWEVRFLFRLDAFNFWKDNLNFGRSYSLYEISFVLISLFFFFCYSEISISDIALNTFFYFCISAIVVVLNFLTFLSGSFKRL